jgi:cytochrome c peroxidase
MLLITGCSPGSDVSAPYPVPWPAHLGTPDIPADNQLTEARVRLGKKLFEDPNLSRDRTISCSSCHRSNTAFATNDRTNNGAFNRPGIRNAPSLLDKAFAPHLNWDGGTASLETQALVPIQAHNEMDMKFDELAERLNADPVYRDLFRQAYDRPADTYSIVRALAAFQRTLYSGKSPYDDYLKGDTLAMNEAARRGRSLFFSEKAECFHCHNGVLLTNFSFQNNGLYAVYPDSGRYQISGLQRDIGRFVTPTLRNVARTAPYMHDGSLPTLEAVLDHYIRGGHPHPNKNPVIQPLTLTAQDKADLIAFLESLSDR